MSLPLVAAAAALLFLMSKKKVSAPAPVVVDEAPPRALPSSPVPVSNADRVFNTDPEAEPMSPVQAFESSPVVPVQAPPVPAPVPDNPEPAQPTAVAPLEPSKAVQQAQESPGEAVEEVQEADPVAAARELAAYVAKNRGKGAMLGVKGKPSPTVKALQLQMGVTADGIYGPATRQRGTELGVGMPPRA